MISLTNPCNVWTEKYQKIGLDEDIGATSEVNDNINTGSGNETESTDILKCFSPTVENISKNWDISYNTCIAPQLNLNAPLDAIVPHPQVYNPTLEQAHLTIHTNMSYVTNTIEATEHCDDII